MTATCERAHETRCRGARREPAPQLPGALEDEARFIAGLLTNRATAKLGAKAAALIGLAAVTALRVAAPMLEAHVRDALAEGATRDEIVATIVEAALYAGFAAARAGLEAAFSVLTETDARHSEAL